MIAKASSGIVKWLLHAGAIMECDKELYEYAAYSFFFSLLPLGLVTILGGISGMVLEGIMMILPFMLIRKFSGGAHLKSPGKCLIYSTLLLTTFLFIIRIVTVEHLVTIFTCFVTTSAIQIFFCSPIDNEARKLNEKEAFIFKMTARIMSLLFLTLYVILLSSGQLRLSIPIGGGIILTSVLQVPCFFTGKQSAT